MKDIFKEYLFAKRILVSDAGPEEKPFEVAFSLANLLGIRVTAGAEHLHRDMIRFAEKQLGASVPEPFYRSFPDGVRELSPDKLLFDQMVHYSVTYGFGNFSAPGHSLLEEPFERLAFKEKAEVRDFRVLTEAEAKEEIARSVQDLARSTRPLNEKHFGVLEEYVREHGSGDLSVSSKDTSVRLLLSLRDLAFAKPLSLADVSKVAERLQWDAYKSADPKKLNWKNQDRKFMTALIRDRIAAGGDWRECFEKQARWAGLLHQIHFAPETEREKVFCGAMRSGENRSVYSAFERALAEGNAKEAAGILAEGKGAGAVLRQMNYLLSRGAGTEIFLPYLREGGSVLLIQLLMGLVSYESFAARDFSFARLGLMRVHKETKEETDRRRSLVPEPVRTLMAAKIREELARRYRGRLGTVYLDPAMKKTALPVSESTSQGGFGVLPRGSRKPMPAGKKLRAFTYWEKVDDIDLSVIGIDREGKQYEFSWRTMAGAQSDAIVYSGDQTSGYRGGSEFFDLDMEEFRRKYPEVRRLVFCDNIYSRGITYADCVCRAGVMEREIRDSGEIFEPKTVTSAFTVNCRSSFACLFGLDLETDEFIWLNTGMHGDLAVAGESGLSHLKKVFDSAEILSLYDLIDMMALRRTDDPAEAGLIVSDAVNDWPEGKEILRSCDIDRILALMESR